MTENKDYTEILKLAKILSQQTDFDDILRIAAGKASQIFNTDLALILMVNPDTRQTVNTIVKDGRNIEQEEYSDIHIHVGGWIIYKKQTFISNDIRNDKRFLKRIFEKSPIKSVAGVPLFIEGNVIGALLLLYKESDKLIDAELIEQLEYLASIATPYLRNAQKIKEFFNTTFSKSNLLYKYQGQGLYGKSQRFIELLKAIEAASGSDVRILLMGSTGTGKELIARSIHEFSSRASFPFVTVDCASIPESLIESELFGYMQGAFTGAHANRKGLIEEANGGTLFIDEINNLPFNMQSKLLRVLEESEIRPVGSSKTIKIDARIIAAASVDLKKLVEINQFREDLFFRLHVYPIYVPELKERGEDVTILANHFLQRFGEMQNKNVERFNAEVIDFIKEHEWKGNVRELENFIERMVTIIPKEVNELRSDHFPDDLLQDLKKFHEEHEFNNPNTSLKDTVQNFEAKIIEETLNKCDWNQSEAARRLNTSERNIRYKIKTLGIKKSQI